MDILNIIVSAVAGGLAGLISGVLKEPLVEKYRQHQNKKSLFSEMGSNYSRLNTSREILENINAEMNLPHETVPHVLNIDATRTCYDFLTKDVVMFSRMPCHNLIHQYYQELETAKDPQMSLSPFL
jgi:hypothetical protein